MATNTNANIDAIGSDLARGARTSEGVDRVAPLFRSILRLLLAGEPVEIGNIAAATGRDPRDVASALAAFEAGERDEAGRIVGMGLTLNPTPHRFRTPERELYTWCALDTLTFPSFLGVSADIESPCHATGMPVRVKATPQGVTVVEPPTAVVSLVPIDHAPNIRTAFCDHVHYFRSTDDASAWLRDHPGGRIVSVRDAFDLGRGFAAGLEA